VIHQAAANPNNARMATQQELEDAIALIDERLNAGASAVETDGLKASIDLKQLRTQRSKLKRELDALLNGTSSSPFRPIQM